MTTTEQQTVEDALVELRETFPDRCVSVCVTLGLIANQVSVSVRNPDDNGTRWGNRYEAAATLSDAMNQMRQWHAEQAKES